jgi:hypothetical protein
VAEVREKIVKREYVPLIPGASVLVVRENGAEVARPGPWWRLSLACLHSYLVRAEMVGRLLRPPPEGLMQCPECTAYDNAVERAREQAVKPS